MKKLSVLLLMSVWACTKDDSELNPPFSTSAMWEAHSKTQWSVASVGSQLLGQWKWVYTVCCPEGELTGRDTEQEDLLIFFNEDGTFAMQVPGEADVQTTWALSPNPNDGTYRLETGLPVTPLYGRILFNDTYVLFNNSYIDGADNYFKRL